MDCLRRQLNISWNDVVEVDYWRCSRSRGMQSYSYSKTKDLIESGFAMRSDLVVALEARELVLIVPKADGVGREQFVGGKVKNEGEKEKEIS